MKKRVVMSLALVSAMALSLVGCGGALQQLPRHPRHLKRQLLQAAQQKSPQQLPQVRKVPALQRHLQMATRFWLCQS